MSTVKKSLIYWVVVSLLFLLSAAIHVYIFVISFSSTHRHGGMSVLLFGRSFTGLGFFSICYFSVVNRELVVDRLFNTSTGEIDSIENIKMLVEQFKNCYGWAMDY